MKRLSDQKVSLSEALLDQFSRARLKLEHDVYRMRVIQGEHPPEPPPTRSNARSNLLTSTSSVPGLGNAGLLGTRPDLASHMSESVRNALMAVPSAPSPSNGLASQSSRGEPANKSKMTPHFHVL